MLRNFIIIIVMAWVTEKMIVGNLNMIMIKGISRMSRNTNPIDRRRSNERTSREGRPYKERRQIVCYKCNNFGHIAQNRHAPDDQQNPRSRTPVCQLCNNFGHTNNYFKMYKNFRDRRNNERKFKNERND